MLQTSGILISANHLTIAHDDRSCGQGGEMWFQWEGGGYICGCCNNGTQGMLMNRRQLGGTLLVLPANGLWPRVRLTIILSKMWMMG